MKQNSPALMVKSGKKQIPAIFLLLIAAAVMVLVSCETPEKVLKSRDLDYQKAKAIYWYNKKEYVKAIPVLEELIGLMKGRQSTDELYYMYCMANYKQGDYMISAYHFKNFYDLYPTNEKAEECLFMYAKSYEQLSPKPDLDQTYTLKSLESYELFLNSFPNSKYLKDVNTSVDKMRRKLQKKALNTAELYYRTTNYKAAVTCYQNILKDFPDIDESEFVSYMIIKSNYKYAENSVAQKKAERYDVVIKSYNEFKSRFSASKYLEDVKKFEQQSHYLAVKSAFDWAETGPLLGRSGYFENFFTVAKTQLPYITDKKELAEVNELIEKGHFLVVKNNFLISEEKKMEERRSILEETVKSYYTFVDKFPKSRYSREAERIFNNSTEQLKKLKTNG